MSTKTLTEVPTLRGRDKYFYSYVDFRFMGQKIGANETIGPLTDEATKELLSHQHKGHIIGGLWSLEDTDDEFPRWTDWNRKYQSSERWYKVKFIKEAGFFPAGFKCRLRMTDIRELTNRLMYEDSATLPSSVPTPCLMIMEKRTKPSISPAEAQERAASIEEGLAKESRPSWLKPVLVAPKD
jgi:hypothetical protein